MEPPPFGGGNICVSGHYCENLCHRYPFNGATPFRRWKSEGQILYVQGVTAVLPSMEPPPFGGGNLPDGTNYWYCLKYLTPSMEPPPFGGGNLDRAGPVLKPG